MRTDRNNPLLLVLALVALCASGCIFSPDTDQNPTPNPGPEYPFPSTLEQLMENFKTAYTSMDIDGYRDMLHDEFKFIFLPGEGPSDFFTRQEELSSAENMFSGEPHVNPDGDPVRAISSIRVENLDPVEPWEDVPPSYPYFGEYADDGAQIGYYQVRIVLEHDDGTITVSSKQFFFAIPVEEDQNGTTRTRWKLIGQEDSDVA